MKFSGEEGILHFFDKNRKRLRRLYMKVSKVLASILLATIFFTYGVLCTSEPLSLPLINAYASSAFNSNLSSSVDPVNLTGLDALTDIDFIPWGNENDLRLSIVNHSATSPVYRMNGSTGNESAGFSSPNLSYKGKYLSLTLVNGTNGTASSSSSPHFQVSFVFNIDGMRNDYRVMSVYGPSLGSGWKNNTYYEDIHTNSSRIINLEDLLEFHNDSYLSVEKIVIIVSRQSTFDLIDFKIELSKAIENFPT